MPSPGMQKLQTKKFIKLTLPVLVPPFKDASSPVSRNLFDPTALWTQKLGLEFVLTINLCFLLISNEMSLTKWSIYHTV